MKAKRIIITIVIIILILGVSAVGFYYYVDAWDTQRHLTIRFKYARGLFADNQYDEALPIFKDIVEVNPNFAAKYGQDAYFYLGTIYKKKGDYDEAKKQFYESVKRKLNATSYIALSLLLFQEKNYKESVKILEKELKTRKLKKYPSDIILTYEDLFYAYASLREKDKALAYFKKFYNKLKRMKNEYTYIGQDTGQEYALYTLYAYSKKISKSKQLDWEWIKSDPEYQALLKHYKEVFEYDKYKKQLKDIIDPDEETNN